MEVHAHTHSSPATGGAARKKWTHYFWEFLMLFLAVFCGFMAENIREHKIERIRAKEFSRSLIKDLQNDTTAIHFQHKASRLYIAITDSLLELSKKRLDGRNAAVFSFYTRFTYWTVPIIWNRATFEQVKNSGSLRYFKNYTLLEKMMQYDVLVHDIQSESNNNTIRGNMLLNQISRIIDPAFHFDISKYMLLSLDSISKETLEHFFSVKTESLETKRNEIQQLLNMAIVQQRNHRYNESFFVEAEKLAVELISDLKKEYHFE